MKMRKKCTYENVTDKTDSVTQSTLITGSEAQVSLTKEEGKISTSTTTTSLYTDDEQETQEVASEAVTKTQKQRNTSPGAVQLRSWLNQLLRITMTDGRVLVGMFFCTDRHANIILGACSEYLPEGDNAGVPQDVEEPRILGLVMVPGKYVVDISIDQNEEAAKNWNTMNHPLSNDDEATAEDAVM